MTKSNIAKLLASMIVLATAVAIFYFRQPLIDQFNYRQYQPTAEMKAIVSRAALSDEGTFYLYTSHPQVQDRATFNSSCHTAGSETTAVLGCYATRRIYLFNVTDTQLDGIKEVTAAHEMLHAAYDRLPDNEKIRVNELLDAQAAKITDPDFVALMKEYDKSEPGERFNELHSIIGTQVRTLGTSLEAYYAQYFKNRSAVVDLYDKYQAVFAGIKSQQTQLANDLDALVTQIDSATKAYNEGAEQLSSDIKSFNARAENGGFSSQAQFNRERAALVARQQQLATDRAQIDGYIATYNTKRQELLAVNGQAKELNQSINSNLTPVPSI